MLLPKTKKALILGLALLVAGFGFAGGCGSTTLPPRITAEQRALLHKIQMAVTVGVEDYKYPVYSDGLTKALQNTHLFARVDHLKNFTTAPDIVARVEESIHGNAVIPMLTGLSLGIIPTTTYETHGYSFSLSRPGIGTSRVPVRFAYSGPTTLGWWAMVLNMLPDRTMRDVYSHPRFVESFAWEIATKRGDIEALITK